MAGKAEVVDAISNEAGLSKKDATAALEAAINAIAGNLKRNERVALPGLGVFNVGERKARAGINPQTKAAIRIPASKVAKFKAGKDLKELLNRKKK